MTVRFSDIKRLLRCSSMQHHKCQPAAFWSIDTIGQSQCLHSLNVCQSLCCRNSDVLVSLDVPEIIRIHSLSNYFLLDQNSDGLISIVSQRPQLQR